jgi:predicted dithiol-disulfide oxidoreductase (DUF899 family)
MSLPEIVSRQDWLAQRRLLLDREKELTRQRDAVNAERRQYHVRKATYHDRYGILEGEER